MRRLILLTFAVMGVLFAYPQDVETQTPTKSPGQSAEDYYKKGKEYFDKKDYQNSLEWFQKAADQGYSNAQNFLGYMYENGYGVTQDYTKAVELYQKAADQGLIIAQCNLGLMYANGYGVTQDYDKAIKWYQKAANQGNARAQNNLGLMYQNGWGVTQDYVKAVELYRKAANQGLVIAQCNLGLMYDYGYGVEKDYAKAVEWYQKAANQGYERAKNNLAILQKKMDEEKKDFSEQPKPGIEMVDTDIPVVNVVNNNTIAIIIANEDYKKVTKVDYAMNDGKVFRDYCHKTLGLPEDNIHFIVNATLADLYGEIDWLQRVCKSFKGDASVIFYYAGHGFPDGEQSSYLLPIDGDSRTLRTCLSLNELYKTLGSLPAKKITVVMDACFSGAKRNDEMLTSGTRDVHIKAEPGEPRGNMIVFSAAQGDETAYKYEEAKHGLFTYFLLKKLKESKGNVTIGELGDYVQDQVGRYSILKNRKSQTPTVQASKTLSNGWQNFTFY